MTQTTRSGNARYDFILSRSTGHDGYGLWRFDPDAAELLQPVLLDPGVSFDRTHQLVSIGRYLLEWGPLAAQAYHPFYPYRLFEFDPTSKTPLAGKVVQQGIWTKKKFWQYRPDFGNPNGAKEGFDSGEQLLLVPLGNFALNLIPTVGRGTFQLWNFDPSPFVPADPLPAPYTPQGSFDSIQIGHELTPLGNYVLDRDVQTSDYWLWSFDPQSPVPLALPAVQHGHWTGITARHQLTAIGEHVLSWIPGEPGYDLWRVDPRSADPLVGPVRSGTLPAGFDADTRLTGVQPPLPIAAERRDVPGTIDFMRAKIKHVVYYMVENRSFDHVCGWLYEKGEQGVRFIGNDAPFDGVRPGMSNANPGAKPNDPTNPDPVPVSKVGGGKVDEDQVLDLLTTDPYHDKSDVLRQLFYANRNGYAERAMPDMGGFVWNNDSPLVMQTYTPEQLPVINGLARGFAVSDAWFSSMPGATDPNRAFAFTGSTLGQLNNFQNGLQYTNWPAAPHRPSMWKVLWSNGITDWKLYYSVEWMNFVHTYHLFLQGQIPSVDAYSTNYIASIDQFKQDAKAGKLPAFSFLEPVWIASGATTSYHPGPDLVPGERALNEIYEALKAGPAWNETLLVITFDEHGGIFDHAPPPYAVNPWPNDSIDGFAFDLMGVRVPTIVVSPWIAEQTVFRSPSEVAYDSTSFMSTLLQWCGIPKSRWGLGDRTHHAPSFEGLLTQSAPRSEVPKLDPPYDKAFPREGEQGVDARVHDLHRLMTPRLVWAIAGAKLGAQECLRLADDMLAQATDLKSLHAMIDALAKRVA